MSEVEETLNRIKTHKGVSGIVIVGALLPSARGGRTDCPLCDP